MPPPKRHKIAQCDRLAVRGFEQGWPNRTDVHCWWCAHPFDTLPVGLPVARGAAHEYLLHGVYCSFSCMKAELATRSLHHRSVTAHLMQDMMREVYREFRPVQRAPPRCMLRVFGGELTIEQFRDKFTAAHVNLISPPLVAQTIYVEEIPVVDRYEKGAATQSFAQTPAPLLPEPKKSPDALKLRRDDPLPCTGKSSLDLFMGIERPAGSSE